MCVYTYLFIEITSMHCIALWTNNYVFAVLQNQKDIYSAQKKQKKKKSTK